MNSEYLQKYARNFPITTILLLINLVIFFHNQVSYPFVAMPGVINLNSFLANFSHIGLMHFGFNMLVLWQISPLIEVKFRHRLAGRSGIFYAGIILAIASLITLGVAKFSNYPTLGFSGIGLGMMIFAGFLYWKNKHIAKQLLGWAVANIVLGLTPGISFAGHFIGALAGALIFGVIYFVFPKNEKSF